MTTPPPAAEPRTALELIVECIARLRRTDPADTAAALLVAWHGFGAAEAAGALLARDNLEDAVLARNARPVLSAVVRRLRTGPPCPTPTRSSRPLTAWSPTLQPTTTPHRSRTRPPSRRPLRPAPCAAASSRSRWS